MSSDRAVHATSPRCVTCPRPTVEHRARVVAGAHPQRQVGVADVWHGHRGAVGGERDAGEAVHGVQLYERPGCGDVSCEG